ncbi:MAG: hypothetical protein AABZ47_16295 [Planctomycetota bacterium]
MNDDQHVHGKDKNTACHKAAWVMSILSDDEATQQVATLPQGLQFHLGRCASCRALADRIIQTSRDVAELSREETPAHLLQSANARTLHALHLGAPLSAIAESVVDDLPIRPQQTWVTRWSTRYAAAALIVISATLWGFLQTKDHKANAPFIGPDTGPITRGQGPDKSNFPLIGNQSGEPIILPTNAANSQVADTGKIPNIRRYRTHEEAAESDDPRIIPTAVVLPDLSQRDVGLLMWFDKPTQFLSNRSGSDHK